MTNNATIKKIKLILFSCLIMIFCGYSSLVSYFININSFRFDLMITFIPLFALGVGILACLYPRDNLATE